MLWIKALHIIFVVSWFSGLFYLPRLFVYHAETTDALSNQRFKTMERKLFWGIMTPSGILASIFGLWLLFSDMPTYLYASWLHIKLTLVVVLWLYHGYCGKCYLDFKNNRNRHGHVFYRWFNEFPVLLLTAIVILVVIKPNI